MGTKAPRRSGRGGAARIGPPADGEDDGSKTFRFTNVGSDGVVCRLAFPWHYRTFID